MPGATSGKFTVKSCGKAHAWCAECRPKQAAAQRKPKAAAKVYERPCRNCGRCDSCLGLQAPDGMKLCRSCDEVKPVTAFALRADTGGRRNACIACRNSKQSSVRCSQCSRTFMRTSDTRILCAACRPPITKPCATCGAEFVGSMEQRRYCSPECRDATLDQKRRLARKKVRLEALQAYGGPTPSCSCCNEGTLQFLALDHIDGGGRQHRLETGGGGFYTWLRRHGYPAGFRVLCHNCNMGRQINGGTCPHQES